METPDELNPAELRPELPELFPEFPLGMMTIDDLDGLGFVCLNFFFLSRMKSV